MRKLTVLCLALLLLAGSIAAPPQTAQADHAPYKLDPILFIPGTAGSIMKFVPGTEPRPLGIVLGEAWPDVNRAIFSGWRNMDPMRLQADGKESHYNHQWYPSEPIRWANLYGMGVSDIYGSFLHNFMENELHLVEGRDYDTFAYDWMRVDWSRDAGGADKRTMERLRSKILSLSARNGGRDVVLVSHSLGGLIAREYIVKYEGDRVKAHIGMATPYLGTMMTYQTLRWGWNFGIPTISPAAIQELSGNWPVSYRLLPMGPLTRDPFVWNPNDKGEAWLYQRDVPGDKATRYSPDEIWSQIRNRNPALFDEAHRWRASLLNGEDYAVRQYNIVGTGRPTVYGFKAGTVMRNGQEQQSWVSLETDQGDNTIPLASATLTDWQGRPLPKDEGVGELSIRQISLPTHCGVDVLGVKLFCSEKGHTDIPALSETHAVLRTLFTELAATAKPPIHKPFPYKLTLNPYWNGNTLHMNASIRLTDIGLPRDDLGQVHSGTVTFEVFRPSCSRGAALSAPYMTVQAKMPSGYWIQPAGLIGSSASVEIPFDQSLLLHCVPPGNKETYYLNTDLFHVRATFQPRDGKSGGRTIRYDAITSYASTTRQRFPLKHHQVYSDLDWIPDRGRAIEIDATGWDTSTSGPVIYTTEGAPKVRFTRYVDLPWAARRAVLALAVDDRATVWVNGKEIGTAAGFTSRQWFTFSLEQGRNTIEIEVENHGGPAGFAANLQISKGELNVNWTYEPSETPDHYDFDYLFTAPITGEPVEGLGYYIVWDEKTAAGKTGKDGRVRMTVPRRSSYTHTFVVQPSDYFDVPRSSTRYVDLPQLPTLINWWARPADGAFEASVMAAAGPQPVEGLTLTAEFRGRTYTATTGKDGYARFRMEQPPEPGDYRLLFRLVDEHMMIDPLAVWATVHRPDRQKKPVISGTVAGGELSVRLLDGERPISGQDLIVQYMGAETRLLTDREGFATWQFEPPGSDEPVGIEVSHRPSGGFLAADPFSIAANGLKVRYSTEPPSPVVKELTATAGAEGVALTWGAFGEPHDGYYVFRSTAAGQYDPVPLTDFPLLGTSFVDTGVEPGRTYYYVVRTYRKDSGDYPASSNEAQASP